MYCLKANGDYIPEEDNPSKLKSMKIRGMELKAIGAKVSVYSIHSTMALLN